MVSLHPGGKMGTGDILLGVYHVTLQWTSISWGGGGGGGVAMPLIVSYYRNKVKLQPCRTLTVL